MHSIINNMEIVLGWNLTEGVFLHIWISLNSKSSFFFPGVPLSTQWGPQGYFYAIQIAQYGLSHYSKNLTERAPHVEVYDTAEDRDSRASSAPWTVPKGCSLSRVYDKIRSTTVRQFSAPGKPSSLGGWRLCAVNWT